MATVSLWNTRKRWLLVPWIKKSIVALNAWMVIPLDRRKQNTVHLTKCLYALDPLTYASSLFLSRVPVILLNLLLTQRNEGRFYFQCIFAHSNFLGINFPHLYLSVFLSQSFFLLIMSQSSLVIFLHFLSLAASLLRCLREGRKQYWIKRLMSAKKMMTEKWSNYVCFLLPYLPVCYCEGRTDSNECSNVSQSVCFGGLRRRRRRRKQ